MALFFHCRCCLLQTKQIPGFKDTELPSETCFDSSIQGMNIFCYSRHPMRSITEHSIKKIPKEGASQIVKFEQAFDSLTYVLGIFYCVNSCESCFFGCLIFQCLCIDGKKYFLSGRVFCFLVKALSAFISQQLLLQHFFDPQWQQKLITRFIIGAELKKPFCHKGQCIQSNNISCSEGC